MGWCVGLLVGGLVGRSEWMGWCVGLLVGG